MKDLALKNKHELRLVLKKPENVEISIENDIMRFKQVIDNLLNNAIKFTEKGTIEFGYKIVENRTAIFYIQDTGIGIAPKDHEIIFERFRQVDDSETRLFGGTGLGLAICRHLIILMGGKIWIESKLGEGSTFFFSLHFNQEHFHPDPKNEQISVLNAPNWKGRTILVVDDIELVFEHVSALLDFTQAQYFYFKSGKKVIEYVKEHEDIDLILLDIQMSEMGGTEVMLELKKIRPNLPILAQTANVMAEYRKKYIEVGFDEYIAKPIEMNDLYSKIDRFLKK